MKKRARFARGDRARISHTSIVFDVAYASPDGEVIASETNGRHYAAAFCEKIPRDDPPSFPHVDVCAGVGAILIP